MRRTIIIAENFYSDPDSVVAYAKSLTYMCPYNTVEECQSGAKVAWRASRWRPASECPFKSSEALIAKLEFLTGEVVDRESWNLDFPVDENGHPRPGYLGTPRSAWWNCTFHAKHQPQVLGQGVHSHTDRDGWNAAGAEGWAGLVYLDKDAGRQTGLRTWENIDPRRRLDWMTPPDNWILCDTLANVYNRLILHRGDIPHSGSAGWGQSIEDGRFYQTLFFRTLSNSQVDGVLIRIGSRTETQGKELIGSPIQV